MARYMAVFNSAYAAELRGSAGAMERLNERLGAISAGIDTRDAAMAALKKQLCDVAAGISALVCVVRAEGDAWERAAAEYERAERNTFEAVSDGAIGLLTLGDASAAGGILARLFGIGGRSVPASHSSAEAYSGNGAYGGNQSSPVADWSSVKDIVSGHFPDMSDADIRALLSEMEHEGCGYMALSNTVFAPFEGREDEFERVFGFPMRRDGDLNYNAVIVDLYCDNYIRHGRDSESTDEKSRRVMWEAYMRSHGVAVKVDNSVRVTPANYARLAKKGEIIVRMNPVRIIDESGRVVEGDAGHAMTMTGVTEDGKYIVSSWGQKYYLDPRAEGDYNIDYQQVIYK
jgi:hypothetical protein